MAIYHLSTKPVSRSSGRSAVASAAYRCAVLLTNHRDGLVHDFTRKEGVEHKEIVLPEGLSAAIRFGALADSSLVARQIAPNRRVICGAPAYLDRRGRPETIEDLIRHEVIAFGEPPNTHWTFADGRSVNVMGRLTTNNGELAHRWALSGAGLVLKSIWDVYDDIESGKLEIILPDVHLAAAPIHVVFPHTRLAAAKVRLCIEFLANRLKSSKAALRF